MKPHLKATLLLVHEGQEVTLETVELPFEPELEQPIRTVAKRYLTACVEGLTSGEYPQFKKHPSRR